MMNRIKILNLLTRLRQRCKLKQTPLVEFPINPVQLGEVPFIAFMHRVGHSRDL